METTFTDGRKVACPVSAAHFDLDANWKLHFATPSELRKHGGVCKRCAEKFAKAHGTVVSGQRVETPVDLNEHHAKMTLDQDHAAFDVQAGQMAQVSEFPFNEIDQIIEDAPEQARHLAGEVLRQLFNYCFTGGNLTSAAAKFAVICGGLRPDALGDETQTELGKRLGLTKAAMSKASVKFQDAFGIKFARSRPLESRAKMRARRLGGPDRHHL